MKRLFPRRRFSIILSLLLCAIGILPLVCWGGADVPLKDVVAALEGAYGALSDVHADFSQRSTIAAFKREERGKGELFIKKPVRGTAMFRFNYSLPQKQEIVSDGKTVWLYTDGSRQARAGELAAMLDGGGGITLNYLTGLGRVSRDFTISFAGDGKTGAGYLLELIPKKKNTVIARLQLTVTEEAVSAYRKGEKGMARFPLGASVVYDHAGNSTAMEFSRIRINRGLADSLFVFTPPRGVDVVKTSPPQ